MEPFIAGKISKNVTYIQAKLKESIQQLIAKFETFLKSRGSTPEALCKVDYFFVAKLLDWKKDRYTFVEISEDVGQKHKENGFLILTRDSFSSYSSSTIDMTEATGQ